MLAFSFAYCTETMPKKNILSKIMEWHTNLRDIFHIAFIQDTSKTELQNLKERKKPIQSDQNCLCQFPFYHITYQNKLS